MAYVGPEQFSEIYIIACGTLITFYKVSPGTHPEKNVGMGLRFEGSSLNLVVFSF